LIAVLFLKEKAGKTEWLGITLLIIGAVFLATNAQFSQLTLTQNLIGNTLVIAACLFWGIDNNLSKFLCLKDDLILITALKCIIGGTILLLVAQIIGLSFVVPINTLPYLLTVGAFSIGFSILFFMLGLREIGSIRTGIIFSTSSLFGALFAFAILRENLTVIQALSGLMMLLGVYILYRKSPAQVANSCELDS
jgi:drug/metabolite transporter (DMT)-like permease